MTNREFYTAIANGTITEEIVAHASAALTKLDEANEKRKNKPSKKSTENAPILEAITNALTTEVKIAADIAVEVGITTAKASALLRQLVAAKVAQVTDVKVPKKGTVKGYSLAAVETEAEVETTDNVG